MVERKMKFVQEVASEVPWYRFKCEDCGAFRDQRLRRNYTIDQLWKAYITCAGCHGQAYITNCENPVLGYCERDWWVDGEGNEVGHRAPRDFMQPSGEARAAGWLRKLVGKVKTAGRFLAGEG